ncbi:ATP-binding protein [Methylocella sp.]|uniref:ATP-binding protein n=1 Tax=Methylocella sp. TaxID=1978226 RepID=UPI0037852694
MSDRRNDDAPGAASRRLRVASALAAAVLAGAGLLALAAPDTASLALLAVLSAFGVFCGLAFAAGWLRFGAGASPDGLRAAAFERSPHAMAAQGENGEILRANAAYRALCGARGLRRVERLLEDAGGDAAQAYRLAQNARSGGAPACDMPAPPTDGAPSTRLRVEARALPPDGRTILWTLAALAPTDAARADGAEILLDDLPVAAFRLDARGAVEVNALLAALTGRERNAPARLDDLFGPDGAKALGAAGENRTETLDLDLDLLRGDERQPVRVVRRLAFDADGAARAAPCLVLERAAEQRVGEARSVAVRFARMFEATPIAIASLDAGGAILRANAAFGRIAPEALKPAPGSILRAVTDRDRPALQAALAAAARDEAEIGALDVALAGEGERSARFFLSSAGPGESPGATLFALDATEQRALQNNFAQSQKMQAVGQLAGGVAHDFNNVLTAIIGFSDLLLANHRPTDPSFRDIMQIKQNALRAAGLVRQLLAFSRRQTLRPQVLQLGDVLNDLQMMMRRLVGEKIHLELRHGRDLWPVRADLNQLEQVIVNLIVNARDAMPDGGDIVLKTRNVTAQEAASFEEASLAGADYVAVEVEDHGHGVPAEVREKIFEPFFTTKEVGKGTGLGLSMVYGIVKQTGGAVFCSSPPGGGATFTVLLPRNVAAAEHAPAAPEKAKPAADLTGRGVILLVEDEEAVRAFGARALASRGYSVLQAASGLEALEVADENRGRIDLVVSDVVMPEMDGPTMLGELRKRGVSAKVIFVSGYAEEAFARNLPEGEDFGFLPKPFSLKQLIEAVKQAAA